jgi:hypothetical protein
MNHPDDCHYGGKYSKNVHSYCCTFYGIYMLRVQ